MIQSPRSTPDAAISGGPPSDVLSEAGWFEQLALDLDRCLKQAKAEYNNLRWILGHAANRSDLHALLETETCIAVAGRSKSYEDFFEALLQGTPFQKKNLAALCGYFIIPTAAHHFVHVVRRHLLSEPLALCRPLILRDFRPGKEPRKLRGFWVNFVLPKLKELYPDRLVTKDADPWAVVTQ